MANEPTDSNREFTRLLDAAKDGDNDSLDEATAILAGLSEATQLADGLDDLVDLALARKQIELAAQWLGHAAMLREKNGIKVSPEAKSAFDERFAAVGEALGERGLARAWSRGRKVTTPQVLELTLGL